jgi:hypothetical protein
VSLYILVVNLLGDVTYLRTVLVVQPAPSTTNRAKLVFFSLSTTNTPATVYNSQLTATSATYHYHTNFSIFSLNNLEVIQMVQQNYISQLQFTIFFRFVMIFYGFRKERKRKVEWVIGTDNFRPRGPPHHLWRWILTAYRPPDWYLPLLKPTLVVTFLARHDRLVWIWVISL